MKNSSRKDNFWPRFFIKRESHIGTCMNWYLNFPQIAVFKNVIGSIVFVKTILPLYFLKVHTAFFLSLSNKTFVKWRGQQFFLSHMTLFAADFHLLTMMSTNLISHCKQPPVFHRMLLFQEIIDDAGFQCLFRNFLTDIVLLFPLFV